jgi:glycosyltransferase involved in cell wall biosynthesis
MTEFRIAYFINQYPKVSHSFIRREILALERQGFEVLRMALRGWDSDLVDDEDIRERSLTRYVLGQGLTGLLVAVGRMLLAQPLLFLKALLQALKLGIRADRPWPYHLVYLAEACRIVPWMHEFNARHVHAHFGTNSAEVVMLARIMGGPAYSFTVHGPEEFDKPVALKIREKARLAAFVVAISSFGRSQLYRWVDYADWPKIKVVHCGLEQAFYQETATPMPLTPRIVCVGRLCEQKGQLLLIHAVDILAGRGIDIELVLAGDGEMRTEIEGLINELGLQEKIRITGWISSEQVKEEILASRALVLPSFAEGLPVVIMEAMALRRPVISTYVAGIPELVCPGEHGWLCPAGDVEALVAVLKDFLSMPFNMLHEMGDMAHDRVVERHSIDTEARKLAQLFLMSTEAPDYAPQRLGELT